MKCIKHRTTEQISRVTDEQAYAKVRTNEYEFCPKAEWKQKVRDVNKKDSSKR